MIFSPSWVACARGECVILIGFRFSSFKNSTLRINWRSPSSRSKNSSQWACWSTVERNNKSHLHTAQGRGKKSEPDWGSYLGKFIKLNLMTTVLHKKIQRRTANGWLRILESNLPAVASRATKLQDVSKSEPSISTVMGAVQALIWNNQDITQGEQRFGIDPTWWTSDGVDAHAFKYTNGSDLRTWIWRRVLFAFLRYASPHWDKSKGWDALEVQSSFLIFGHNQWGLVIFLLFVWWRRG